MAIIEEAQQRATDLVHTIKREKASQYSCASLLILALAIFAMSVLTVKDLVQLTQQYLNGKSLFTQDLIDASKDVIKLPNMSVCIRFYTEKNEEVNFEKFESYTNFSKFHLNQAFKFAQRVSYADYVTTTLRNWNQTRKGFGKNQAIIDDNLLYIAFKEKEYTFNYTEENLNKFWNNLAYTICQHLKPKLYLVENGRYRKIVEYCAEASIGNMPIVPVDDRTLCFRVPLELIKIQANSETSNVGDDIDESDSTVLFQPIFDGRKIVFSCQPLVIRQLLFPNEKLKFLPGDGKFYKLVAYLPETTSSYTSIGFEIPEDQWSDKRNQLRTEFSYMTGYGRNVWLPLQISIAKKESRLDDLGCVDIYDEAACIMKCHETDFVNNCNCTRFIFRFYTKNVNVSKYPHCSLKHYNICADRQKSFLMKKLTSNYCENRCTKCSKIKLDWINDHDFIHSSVVPAEQRSLVFEEFFNTKLNYSLNETFHDKFELPDLKLQIYNRSYSVMDEYVNDIIEYADKAGGSLKQEYYEALFGRVYVVIDVNTKGFYPNISEELSVTPDGYRSQIGGILGLYLGCSCITAFMLIVNFLKYLRKRWKKHQDERRRLSVQSTEILNLWRFIGKHKDNVKKINDDSTPKLDTRL